MMKKFVPSVVLLFFVLLGLNAVVYLSTDSVETYQKAVPTEPAPEGMKYLAYCDGGVSDQLIKAEMEACMADYPGVFARNFVPFVSLIILGAFSLLSFFFYTVRG